MRNHSVTLVTSKCKGCTNCLKRCPTEAIRVRKAQAMIIDERCIDCGECIRVCPHHAKVAVTDPLSDIKKFKYAIALPAPALYGQFKGLTDINNVLGALLGLGFDDVFEVARAAEIVSVEIARQLKDRRGHKGPLISSACPAVLRLIQVRFPDLLGCVANVEAPMEVAGMVARRDFCARTGAAPEDVGCFFITPCAAKMTAIMNPLGREGSNIDGAISMLEIYSLISGNLSSGFADCAHGSRAAAYGVGWANSGGEAQAVGSDNSLAVDGIFNVIHALEEIENNKFNDLEFFEGLACTGGCVGGALTFENPFVAKARMRRLADSLPHIAPGDHVSARDLGGLDIGFHEAIPINTAFKLGDNIADALQKLKQLDVIEQRLPGLDCGSCGSPTCHALAEDIVRGTADVMNCIVLLKDRVQSMARDMLDMAQKSRN